jgi:hypothetical protein
MFAAALSQTISRAAKRLRALFPSLVASQLAYGQSPKDPDANCLKATGQQLTVDVGFGAIGALSELIGGEEFTRG